jgi:ketosteroid isomerase-like protein
MLGAPVEARNGGEIMKRFGLRVFVRSAVAALALGVAVPAIAGEEVATGKNADAQEASPAPAADPQRGAVVAVVQHWVDAVNRQDVAAVTGPWAGDDTIIDSVPPFHWQGPRAASAWWTDYTALETTQGLADVNFVFESRHVDIVGDRAYVVGDAVVDYKLKTGPLRDVATWTFCLVRSDQTWLLTAWAWGHRDRVAAATPR